MTKDDKKTEKKDNEKTRKEWKYKVESWDRNEGKEQKDIWPRP